MKTDSLFYRLFHSLPELFFTLTGFEYAPLNYEFKAIEVKQTAFRLDGVFLPLVKNSALPIIFVEVQFQADNNFYGRFFSEIFLYLYQYPQTNPCKAVVIYPYRSIETDNIQRYADLINIGNVQRIYLKESLKTNSADWQLDLLKLIIADVKVAPKLAQQIATQTEYRIDVLDLLETILTYKFPHLNRDEVRKMLHIPDVHLDIRTTQYYKDAFTEGKLKGKQEGILEGKQEGILKGKQETLLFLLQQRFGSLSPHLVDKIKLLNLKQMDNLLAQLFNFQQVKDLASWLRQLNH